MIWQVLIVAVLILLNGFFALSELAIVSARRVRLEGMAEAGSRGAARALELAEDPTGFLSTVQVGITLIGIFAGAYGGTTLSAPLAEALRGVPGLAAHAQTLAFTLVVLVTTYLSLIIGELVPKRIALQNAEAIAAAVSGPMALLAGAGKPVVWFLRVSTEAVLRLLGRHAVEASAVTEEEVKALIAEGTDAGVFHEAERKMLEGVIRFADRPVRAIMEPRTAIVWLSADDPLEAVLDEIAASGHSRFPLAAGDLDEIIGIVQVKDVLELLRRGGGDLREVARPPLYVGEGTPALRLLELFRSSGLHMALVVDEYGALEGLATPTDILTSIAGELPEEGAEAEPGAVMREDGSWLMDGSLPIDRASDILGLKGPATDEYATLAGLVLREMGRIPEAGECVDAHGWRFEVVDMDGRRIDKLLVRPSAPADADADPLET
jgi:magnesium and cobalt exporter, CNNM family